MIGLHRPARFGKWIAPAALCLLWLPAPVASADPTPQQAAWWWQDEIRTAAFALGRARTGKVAQWPRMTVPAGSATLPLPYVSIFVPVDEQNLPIKADGKLDEEAWNSATSFAVGPVFDDWKRGPFMLRVRAGRDDKHAYLAIESKRDLTGLGALTPAGELFTVNDKPYRVGPGGGLPEGCIGKQGERHIIELAIPHSGALTLVFPAEVVRRVEGKLPPELAYLGMQRLAEPGASRNHRKPWLWLSPVTMRLVPSQLKAFSTPVLEADGGVKLVWDVSDPTVEPEPNPPGEPTSGTCQLHAEHHPAVYPYQWQVQAGGKTFSMQGFFYRESVEAELAAARAIGERAQASGCSPEVVRELKTGADGATGRAAYCRARELRARAHLSMLDAPLLLVKQHPYFAAHIYDDYYTWHPGGGIYVLEEPNNPKAQPSVRTIIDPKTNETLGGGVYRDPDLSWDARRIVFAHKPTAGAMTSLYEIGLDGRGLRRLTASDKHHDITPAWLPDGRIVFTSTRPKALVPCFNSGVDTLHTMNADGSEIRSISSNNVTEFDPAVMLDGRVLYGRWEYVDKTALYMQSLWTMLPDGRMEEALFANNLAKPTALLDPQPVPGTQMVVASLTPHNGQAVGAIGMIDTQKGKNDLAAVTNFTPEYPVEMDQGLTVGPCDPRPLSADDVLISNNAIAAHGVIELVDRFGHRELVHGDPEISCFAPMLIKRRTPPTVVTSPARPGQPGRFLLVDVHQGLKGVQRGTIKNIRVLEETARTSGIPPGGRWWNQAFLVSWQGAYIVKNILGTVPVEEDGSAYFEVPPGRAVYFEALDAEGREIQRMRTFVQAALGVTRSCIGCHENKKTSPVRPDGLPLAMRKPPAKPQKESWGSGFIDYPTMVQPILDKHCVRCHGGPEGIGKGLDLSGGWTWAFNISYETLIKHRMTGFLNCNNGSVHTSEILPPKTIGSGAAPLAEILIKKHPELTRAQRDLMLAWMDTNSNYYGTWDYTPHATCGAILATRGPLSQQMQAAGCTECHAPGHVGNDWVNLQTPEWSRILRAPMAKAKGGLGVAFCRKRKARQGYKLIDQGVQPPDVRRPSLQPEWDPSGEEHVTFTSTADPHYQAMLSIIRQARGEALARPRIDMPGAEVVAGECRMQVPMPVPEAPPALAARVRLDTAVELAWQRTAEVIGLQYELHRGPAPKFAPSETTQIGLTTAGRFIDLAPPIGKQHYALVVSSRTDRSRPVFASIDVPQPEPPAAPGNLVARPLSGEIALAWEAPGVPGVGYDVYRAKAGAGEFAKVNKKPLARLSYSDLEVEPGVKYAYQVRAVDRRGQESPASQPAEAVPLPEIKEPVFATDFTKTATATLLDGKTLGGRLHGGAKVADGALQLAAAGFATFKHLPEFDVKKAMSVECWVRIDREAAMPVVLACGNFGQDGWFVQRYGGGWRWHVAPISCDGGRPVVGRWTHLVGTFTGTQAKLYQDGKPVRAVDCYPNRTPHRGPLVVGQYSNQSESYQVHGAIAGVKLYQRALRAAEVAEKFKAGR